MEGKWASAQDSTSACAVVFTSNGRADVLDMRTCISQCKLLCNATPGHPIHVAAFTWCADRVVHHPIRQLELSPSPGGVSWQ